MDRAWAAAGCVDRLRQEGAAGVGGDRQRRHAPPLTIAPALVGRQRRHTNLMHGRLYSRTPNTNIRACLQNTQLK